MLNGTGQSQCSMAPVNGQQEWSTALIIDNSHHWWLVMVNRGQFSEVTSLFGCLSCSLAVQVHDFLRFILLVHSFGSLFQDLNFKFMIRTHWPANNELTLQCTDCVCTIRADNWVRWTSILAGIQLIPKRFRGNSKVVLKQFQCNSNAIPMQFLGSSIRRWFNDDHSKVTRKQLSNLVYNPIYSTNGQLWSTASVAALFAKQTTTSKRLWSVHRIHRTADVRQTSLANSNHAVNATKLLSLHNDAALTFAIKRPFQVHSS